MTYKRMHIHLQTHTNIVHKGIKYKCNQCDKEFTQLANRNTHIKSIHQKTKVERFGHELTNIKQLQVTGPLGSIISLSIEKDPELNCPSSCFV